MLNNNPNGVINYDVSNLKSTYTQENRIIKCSLIAAIMAFDFFNAWEQSPNPDILIIHYTNSDIRKTGFKDPYLRASLT